MATSSNSNSANDGSDHSREVEHSGTMILLMLLHPVLLLQLLLLILLCHLLLLFLLFLLNILPLLLPLLLLLLLLLFLDPSDVVLWMNALMVFFAASARARSQYCSVPCGATHPTVAVRSVMPVRILL